MPFPITFYQMGDPKIKVTKTITNPLELTGTLREECSITTPEIECQANIGERNYCYIPIFSRYYYVTDRTVTKNGLVRVSLAVDVLMSNAAQIRKNTAVIARQESKYNLYLDDSEVKTYQYRNIDIYNFPQGFSKTPSFVLATVG